MPHAIEQRDREMIGRHLLLLRNLVERTPAYLLRLGPDVLGIPGILAQVMG
jgi:hypothetical protein